VFQIPRHTGTTEKNNAEVSVIKYLNDPPSVDELKKILALVGITPRELLRQKDAEKAGLMTLAYLTIPFLPSWSQTQQQLNGQL